MKFFSNFLNGFSKALELYPDLSKNNQALSKDWENIGNDFKVSINKFKIQKDESCKTKKKKK